MSKPSMWLERTLETLVLVYLSESHYTGGLVYLSESHYTGGLQYLKQSDRRLTGSRLLPGLYTAHR